MATALGNADKAAEYFKLAVASFPANEVLANNIGEIYFRQNQAERAIEYYRLAVRAKDTWAPSYYRRLSEPLQYPPRLAAWGECMPCRGGYKGDRKVPLIRIGPCSAV